MKPFAIVVAALLFASVAALGVTSEEGGSDPVATGPVPVSDACGPQPVKADGTPWVCTFDDEFDGFLLDRAKWIPQTINFSNGTPEAYACYLDDPANISVSGGTLNLTVRRLAAPVPCLSDATKAPSAYTSGSVSTYHLFSQQYGRFEASLKVEGTDQPGLQETFWLWPDDRVASEDVWPAAGEIDVVEHYSAYPHLGIPFLHYTENDNSGPIPGTNTAWDCIAQRGVFNTWLLEWSPTELRISVNGTTCLVNTSGDRAFQKPYIVAFTQGLGATSNGYDTRAPLPATLSVDHIRVWQ